MASPTDKQRAAISANVRNLHVLAIASTSRQKVQELVDAGWPKADIFLLANQMKDIAERFD